MYQYCYSVNLVFHVLYVLANSYIKPIIVGVTGPNSEFEMELTVQLSN